MADHNVVLTITNDTTTPLAFNSVWLQSGQLSSPASWPKQIGPHGGFVQGTLTNSSAGVSGYVIYNWGVYAITIAFSNPSSGTNKVGVGIATGTGDSNTVWSDMGSNDYKPFTVAIPNTNLVIYCLCTGGETNYANVTFKTTI